MEPVDAEEAKGCCTLTEEQKRRIQKNKERAQTLREQREKAKPYDAGSIKKKGLQGASSSTSFDVSQQVKSSRNTHAGFIIEDDEEVKQLDCYRKVEDEAPALPDELMRCVECGRSFAESYLHNKFSLDVCDKCREPNGKHSMITKSDAKQKYLLQDYHFEGTTKSPALPFVLKKNPHSSHWGEMKLILQCQVEARSYEVWGGREGLEKEREHRGERKEKKKEKQYAKEIKALRRAVRAGQSELPGSKSHVHNFPIGEEKYDADTDSWTKTCSECGFKVSFEKM